MDTLITEASEGGSVPTLALENLTDIPVLIIDGEELISAKQNRISNLTVLAPGKHTRASRIVRRAIALDSLFTR